ncbi:MAG: antibiotic biosynthesis monooxygenase [Rhodanobacter sp.]|jgi:heme-degrading monooxygenase HmoA|uniref:antibiotic biosynthesis monooxygenase family protein n=1 Tax=Rhodanobacter sp. KK11 TaxID=3083255 RepID=UPI00296699D0|nr:antibiotic biosynthesis monooxygenase [Rhodanobacter sp. KK11]MDW2982290.1 antibiotic biosynthesis monooxygenase [Rhodanobacter sp. KK11]
MIAVIFEVRPHDHRKAAYLQAAERLRPLLDQVDGFISIERFESLASPGKILSLSFWRDEEAVRQWRNNDEHRQVQKAGRDSIFAAYHLTVAEVCRTYDMHDRAQAPEDSRAAHDDASRRSADPQAAPGPDRPEGDDP